MKWVKEEEEFIKENYPKNIPLSLISKKIGRTIKSIRRKAERLNISRPRFPSNKPSKRQPRKIIDRRYYLKNKEKVYKRKMERRKRLKEEVIKMLEGKCKICGYNKCIASLDFHHINKDKEGHVAKIIENYSKQKVLKEVEKCILLCANCHRELHYKGA